MDLNSRGFPIFYPGVEFCVCYISSPPSHISEEEVPLIDGANMLQAPHCCFLLAGTVNGRYCCPQLYINHRCFSGPYLNKGRIAELPQSVGPGKCVLVLKEVWPSSLLGAFQRKVWVMACQTQNLSNAPEIILEWFPWTMKEGQVLQCGFWWGRWRFWHMGSSVGWEQLWCGLPSCHGEMGICFWRHRQLPKEQDVGSGPALVRVTLQKKFKLIMATNSGLFWPWTNSVQVPNSGKGEEKTFKVLL